MSFFEHPPAPPPPEPPPSGPWTGPPLHALGGVVPLELLLARTETMVVAVTGISAYPTGVSFTLSTRSKIGPDRSDLAWHHPVHRGRQFRDGVLDPDLLRFGIEFADGRKATNLEMLRALHERQAGAPRAGPVLQTMGGGGNGWRWDDRQWLWPLPPPGPLAFVCEWPAHGIALTRTEVDAGLLIEAASRAQVFWDEPAP